MLCVCVCVWVCVCACVRIINIIDFIQMWMIEDMHRWVQCMHILMDVSFYTDVFIDL